MPVVVDAGIGVALGRGAGDGARRHGLPGEHRDRACAGPGTHGEGDAAGRGGRARRRILAGRMPVLPYAAASSPAEGVVR